MAANIEIRKINGVVTESFVGNGAKERAWHGLGQVYDRPLTAKEALEGSHADFSVVGKEIYFPTQDIDEIIAKGESISAEQLKELFKPIDGKQANVREDYNECLGVVSSNYGIVQNDEAFHFIDVLTSGKFGGNAPTIDCAGVLGNGERIFITAKFADKIKVANNGNDLIDMNVVFTTSHDGSGAVQCMVTPVRVVCQNTLNLALHQNSGKLSLRHTAHVTRRLDLENKENAAMAFKALNLYSVYKQSFEEEINRLNSVKLGSKDIEKILVKSLFNADANKAYEQNGFIIEGNKDLSTKSKNIITNVMDSVESGIGQKELESGTALWLVNGVTSYYQNYKNWKSEDDKMKSILDGLVQKNMQKVYENSLTCVA